MSEYAKALVALGVGAALVAAGVLIPDETLRTLGYGAIGASPLVYAVKNRKQPGDAGYGVVDAILIVFLVVLCLVVLSWFVH